MNEQILYKRYLPFCSIYEIYISIDAYIHTYIDAQYICDDNTAIINSIILLNLCGILNAQDNVLSINKKNLSKDEVKQIIIDYLYINAQDIINNEIQDYIHYCEIKNQFFIYKNNIRLVYSGYVFLLCELGIFQKYDNKLYILNNSFFNIKIDKIDRKKITELQLKARLAHQIELGIEGEKAALEYEQIQLKNLGISKKPLLVSQIDVSVGYDILSYMSTSSEKPDKYIEVKNCDDTLSFYISANELKISKEKLDHYYLFLYNRIKKNIIVICNPYINIFNNVNSDWLINSTQYFVHKVNI